METFFDDILKCCKKEIEDQNYLIEQQVPTAIIRLCKALFIKAMTIIARDDWGAENAKEVINEMYRIKDNNPSPECDRMIEAAHKYWSAVYDPYEFSKDEHLIGATPQE